MRIQLKAVRTRIVVLSQNDLVKTSGGILLLPAAMDSMTGVRIRLQEQKLSGAYLLTTL